jgi:AcrR family transcriptional regulator
MLELRERKRKQALQEKEKREKRQQILRDKEKKRKQILRDKEKGKERKREQILKAAIKLFTERGFDRTTVADIALHANVATGTYYNYFKGKEDAILYFLDRETEVSIDAIQKKAHSIPNFFDQLEELVSVFLNHIFRNKEFARVLMSKRVMLTGAKDNQNERKLLGGVSTLIDLAKQRNAIKSHIDTNRIADLIYGINTMHIICWLNGTIKSKKGCSKRIREAVQLVFDGIGIDKER